MLSPLNRAQGAFLGLAVGDALGTTLEFGPRRERGNYHTDITGGGPFNLVAGDWTDDTAMAMALSASLLATGRPIIATDLLTRFEAWHHEGAYSCTGTCFDIGNQTKGAIDAFTNYGSEVNGTKDRQQGNGGLMRLAPAVLPARTRDEAIDLAVAQSVVTHGSPMCKEFAGMMGAFLFDLIEGKGFPAKFRTLHYVACERDDVVSTGHALATYRAALWCVARTGNFRDAVIEAVNLGGDADTVGAVTGQLAGALYGLDGIPTDWIAKTAWSGRIIGEAKMLFDLRSKPDSFVDAGSAFTYAR